MLKKTHLIIVLLLAASMMYAQDKNNEKTQKEHKHMMEHMKSGQMPDSCKAMMKDGKDMPEKCKKMMQDKDGGCGMMGDMDHDKMHKSGHDMSGEKGRKMLEEGHEMMMNGENFKKNKAGHKVIETISPKEMKMDHGMMGHMKGMKGSMHDSKASIIRKGIIDVAAIDENKDGFVYQDRMDWNVISDKEGNCPICEMKLVKVTIETAKKNLIENGFEVK